MIDFTKHLHDAHVQLNDFSYKVMTVVATDTDQSNHANRADIQSNGETIAVSSPNILVLPKGMSLSLSPSLTLPPSMIAHCD